MKQKYLFIFLTILSAVFACEQIDESALGEKVVVEKVPMSFTAVIERDKDTKTVLSESDSENLKKVLWQPGDAIGVSPLSTDSDLVDVEEFRAEISEESDVSDFHGSAGFASRYMAFYPYSESLINLNKRFIFFHPAVQRYVNGSFDPNAAPMVAASARGEEFEFKNICGIVALRLTGDKAVKSITFSGTDTDGSPIPLGGTFEVDPSADEPVMSLRSSDMYSSGPADYSLTLECGNPVQLDMTVPVPFYIMLPPATYASFRLLIATDDGEVMIKSGKNLIIERSHIKPTAGLDYIETVAIDLSEHGNANSYIVSDAGLYSFDAGVIGNGVYGIIEGAGFHTADPTINPSKAEILWQDRPGVIEGLNYDAVKRKMTFLATGNEGNALVAAKDADDNILWSWHIWSTDNPLDHNYNNFYVGQPGFVMMDRNLGAIRADRGSEDDWHDASGLMYQWGRKDPFTFIPAYDSWNYSYDCLYETDQQRVTLQTAIEHPLTFYGAGDFRWNEAVNNKLWNSTQKTIYDPCPAGYMVPTHEVWRVFSTDGNIWASSMDQMNVSGRHDFGYNFIYDGTNTAYYPSNSRIFYDGSLHPFSENNAYLWSAYSIDDHYSFNYHHYNYTYVDSYMTFEENSHKSIAMSVRCMKDDNYEATLVPMVNMEMPTEITETSSTLNAEVRYTGSKVVTDKGFIWGTTSDLSDGHSRSFGGDVGAMSFKLTGLDPGTIYFVQAYATNAEGTFYSDIMRFTTIFTDGHVNLSSFETANCYMLKPEPGLYSFDAKYKGNSIERIYPNSVVEMWEVDSYKSSVENIISNVRLSDDGIIYFELPDNVVPGNALVAVKDVDGAIIWSWHIWVVDYDPSSDYHTYYSGAKMMDRNLGAIREAANDWIDYSKEVYGPVYQWGRKDPLIGDKCTYKSTPFNDITEAYANPTTYAYEPNGDNWLINQDISLWSSDFKTKHDPCPPGWKVPGKNNWTKCKVTSWYTYGHGYECNINGWQKVWFPSGDIIMKGECYSTQLCRYWTSYSDNINPYCIWLYQDHEPEDYPFSDSASSAYHVRCMKDE